MQASITAAPVSIVAIRISCPGQSTKDTCLTRFSDFPQSLFPQIGRSSLCEGNEKKQEGGGHSEHL